MSVTRAHPRPAATLGGGAGGDRGRGGHGRRGAAPGRRRPPRLRPGGVRSERIRCAASQRLPGRRGRALLAGARHPGPRGGGAGRSCRPPPEAPPAARRRQDRRLRRSPRPNWRAGLPGTVQLIDMRLQSELALGVLPGARWVDFRGAGDGCRRSSPTPAPRSCSTAPAGSRSLLAAQSLRARGYRRAASLAGRLRSLEGRGTEMGGARGARRGTAGPLQPAPAAPRGGGRRAGAPAGVPRCCWWGPGAWALRWRCTWPPPGWGRWASWTPTWWRRATCSARCCTTGSTSAA